MGAVKEGKEVYIYIYILEDLDGGKARGNVIMI